jgi:hypothetical protein
MHDVIADLQLQFLGPVERTGGAAPVPKARPSVNSVRDP